MTSSVEHTLFFSRHQANNKSSHSIGFSLYTDDIYADDRKILMVKTSPAFALSLVSDTEAKMSSPKIMAITRKVTLSEVHNTPIRRLSE